MAAIPERTRAARVTDIIRHDSALLGFAVGAITAVVSLAALVAVGVITVGTCGIGLAAVAAVAAVGGAVGAGTGWLADKVSEEEVPGIKTGQLERGSENIQINKLAAIAVLHKAFCFMPVAYEHGLKAVVEGSGTVFFGCCPAARIKDSIICDAKIASGSDDVLIGGPAVRVIGTRMTWVDDVLDYAGVYMTALSCVTPSGLILTIASSGASYALNRYETPEWVQTLSNVLFDLVDPLSGGRGSSGKYQGRLDAEVMHSYDMGMHKADAMNAYNAYAAGKEAQLLQYQKTGVIPDGLKKPPKKLSYEQWFNQYHLRRNPLPKPPDGPWPDAPKNIDKHAGKMFGVELGINLIQLWRETERESHLPKHPISCDDPGSWLEPA